MWNKEGGMGVRERDRGSKSHYMFQEVTLYVLNKGVD